MAKAKSAARTTNDSAAEFISALNDLQKAANRADFSKMTTARRGGTAMAAEARGADVCGIYKKVKPFMEIIIRIPFIPAKVKEGITLLMTALNVMCPR